MSAQESITFWKIVHSMLRRTKGGEPEKERARGCCQWLQDDLTNILNHTTVPQAEFLGLLWDHWYDHHEAPSIEVVRHHVDVKSNARLQEMMKDFEDLRKNDALGDPHPPEDMPALGSLHFEDFRTGRLQTVLANAIQIAGEGKSFKSKGKDVRLQGYKDAVEFIYEKVNSASEQGACKTRGTLQEAATSVEATYLRNENPGTSKRQIKTGVDSIDKAHKFRLGEFIGVLGFGGAGKTRFLRTWVYRAILEGYNTMHFTFEQTYLEEETRYAVIHSWHPQWGRPGVSVAAFEEGSLSAKDKEFLFQEVLPDLRNIPGKLILEQPNDTVGWDYLKQRIELADHKHPLSMVCVDYLSLVHTSSNNHREEMNQIIQDAKTFALSFRGGDGLLFVTPVQASREGEIRAADNEGRYDVNAIYNYSGFDKAMDGVLYVYNDDDLRAEDKIKMGSCKRRREPLLPPTKLDINHACGVFYEGNPGGRGTSTDIPTDNDMEAL